MAQNQKPFRKKADIGEEGLITEQAARRTRMLGLDTENTEEEQVLASIEIFNNVELIKILINK